jgi:hydrogenase expression/formation protein HypE
MTASRDDLLPPGKLPGELLAHLIARYVLPDSSIVVGPGVGRDAAAIDLGDRLLIVKTDPITFATPDAGRYLVNVNANDIACMGGSPRWLLVTALLPERATTVELVEDLFASLSHAASSLGIVLAGGHSEITIGLDRPILVGMMIGEASPEQLVDPSRSGPGDLVLLTNGIAIEGTSILANEIGCNSAGIDAGLVERAREFIDRPGISVLPAVLALNQAGIRCRALHDPTEGGLATALAELAAATGCGIEVDLDRIPIYPETRALCDELGLDPLGLIASGALLAVVSPTDAEPALTALRNAGIDATRIGTLLGSGAGNWLNQHGARTPLPEFPVDEIARFYARKQPAP